MDFWQARGLICRTNGACEHSPFRSTCRVKIVSLFLFPYFSFSLDRAINLLSGSIGRNYVHVLTEFDFQNILPTRRSSTLLAYCKFVGRKFISSIHSRFSTTSIVSDIEIKREISTIVLAEEVNSKERGKRGEKSMSVFSTLNLRLGKARSRVAATKKKNEERER